MTEFTVTEMAVRPAGEPGECFYCRSKVGDVHKPECVMISKNVLVRMIVEYEITVPNFWDKDQVEFHRNKSSWCSSNALVELNNLSNGQEGCICENARFEYIGNESQPFLSEL